MSDNLTNLIKSALFSAGVTVTTDGGDITPNVIQPAQMTGQEKYNLDQRDSLSVLLFSDLGTITAGATITAKYYARFPNAINDEKLLSTETITAPAITVGNHYVARFSGENLVNCDADYFTITVVLKQAVGSSYTATGQVVVKKKIVEQPLTGVAAPTSETKASLTIQTALKLEAKALGTLGNAVTVKAEANTSDNLAVNVTGNAITILLANTTGSKNTMTLIAALIASTPAANALVNAIVITGATQMTVFTVQSLSGGVNGDVGYQNEIRIDTNNTEWKMCYTTGGCYYWCIADKDVYPALDTEYLSHYCKRLNKPVYKMAKETTTASAGGTNSTAHGIIGFSRLYDSVSVFFINGVGGNLGNYYYAPNDYFTGFVTSTNCATLTPNVTSANSKQVYFKFKYIKV